MSESNYSNICIADAIKNTVTEQNVLIVLQKFVNNSTIQIVNFKLDSYSKDKLGFLGSHRQLKIKFKRNDQDDEETVNFFVKSIPYDCQRQFSLIQEEGFFTEEYIFFHDIINLLLEKYKGEKWAPTCYLAKPDSLIMEDLRNQGYKIRNSFFDCYAEIKSAFATLARFHGCTILAEARINKFAKHYRTLQEHFPNSFKEKVFKRDGQTYIWFSASTKLVYSIGKRLGHNPDNLRKGYEILLEVVKPSKIYRNGICHGDLWTNNIMFDDSYPQPKSILVDYQIIRYAPQVLDLLQLLYLHTSNRFRILYEKELVEFYYTVLKNVVKKYDTTETAKICSLLEVSSAFENLRVFGPALASLYFPIVLLDPTILQEKTETSEDYDKFLFGDRTDFTWTNMQKNETYKEKITEIISELSKVSSVL